VSVTAIGNAKPTETIESKEIYRGFVALRLAACSAVGSIGLSHPRQEKGKSWPRRAAVGAEAAEWAGGKVFDAQRPGVRIDAGSRYFKSLIGGFCTFGPQVPDMSRQKTM
jgi:hypothetical protein